MDTRRKIVVLGAGVSGLSAAYRLSRDSRFEVHVVDKETTAGGVCQSFSDGDFILDYGPHKFYTLLPGILEELKDLMGDDLLEREKKQTLYMHGRHYEFPLKMTEMVLRFPLAKSFNLLASYGAQVIRNARTKKESASYEEFIVERFGQGLYNEIFAPMARKVYGSPEELDRKLAEVRISSPGLVAVIKQLLFRSQIDRTVSAPTFHYPKYGYGMIPGRLKERSEKNGVKFHMGARILRMQVEGGKLRNVVIENAAGETVTLPCDHVVYSIPVSLLDRLVPVGLPPEVKKSLSSVEYRNTIIYYYLLKSKPILPAMWSFFPEAKYRFGRLSEMVQFSPFTAPPGYTSLMVDFTCLESDPVWQMDDERLGDFLQSQMADLKLFAKDQVTKRFSRRFANVYPIYALKYTDRLKAVRSLEGLFGNLFFIGRLGDFNYNNADQCMDMGFRVADHLRGLGGPESETWQAVRENTFERYRIVD